MDKMQISRIRYVSFEILPIHFAQSTFQLSKADQNCQGEESFGFIFNSSSLNGRNSSFFSSHRKILNSNSLKSALNIPLLFPLNFPFRCTIDFSYLLFSSSFRYYIFLCYFYNIFQFSILLFSYSKAKVYAILYVHFFLQITAKFLRLHL